MVTFRGGGGRSGIRYIPVRWNIPDQMEYTGDPLPGIFQQISAQEMTLNILWCFEQAGNLSTDMP